MSIKCKAAVIRNNKLTAPYKDSKPLSIEEINISPPLENEVLVRLWVLVSVILTCQL